MFYLNRLSNYTIMSSNYQNISYFIDILEFKSNQGFGLYYHKDKLGPVWEMYHGILIFNIFFFFVLC